MNPALRHAFFADLRDRLGRGGVFVRLHDAANRVAFWLFRGYHVTRRALAAVPPPDTPAVLVGVRFNFAYELFFWAARSLSQRLAAVLRTREVGPASVRSEEHTSELQSRLHLVCRLLLETKKQYT